VVFVVIVRIVLLNIIKNIINDQEKSRPASEAEKGFSLLVIGYMETEKYLT
jgi:hypothetical protein